MGDNSDLTRARMPGRLKWVLVFVYIQVVGNLGFGILLRTSIDDVLRTGGQLADPTLAYFAEYLSFVGAGALLVAAIAITNGRAWGRTLLIGLEALTIVNGMLTLFSGISTAAIGVVFGFLVISTLFDVTVRSWFDHKAYLRARG